MRMRPPYTIYSVAMVRLRRDGTHMLSTDMFVVSGLNPLTREEAIARLRASSASKWKEEFGPVSDWQESTTSVLWAEVDS